MRNNVRVIQTGEFLHKKWPKGALQADCNVLFFYRRTTSFCDYENLITTVSS